METSRTELFSFLKTNFNLVPGDADVFIFSFPDLGVDHITEIITANLRKPVLGGKKFIIVDFTSISNQAQNSLLKTLEEPQKNTHIFLLTQTSAVFLPTVLSRVHVVTFDEGEQSTEEVSIAKRASSFLGSNQSERLEMVKQILKERDDEEINDGYIQNFTAELERQSHSKVQDMSPFLILDEYMRDSSSSTKLLLEYIALSIPRTRTP